ncbi:TspO/MBR family protein [Aerosakkonemataceae cyanobacterium BLCC-F154]|uniref:TspO/MBR family protein n=1 Tax=Floridaenema fluviatile BLCC-F154 TaxID=3153640 RepID=A0ABV4YKX4_9CYAN
MLNSWMVIGGISLIVALGTMLMRPRDTFWGIELRRPKWLVFEPAIPFIWTFIFICGTGSAILIWDKDPGSLKTWLLMALYLLLEVVTVAYIPLTLRLRSLTVGLILGAGGLVLAISLTLIIWPISGLAAALLMPYLLWSPIGTYTTWEMIQLNPEAA